MYISDCKEMGEFGINKINSAYVLVIHKQSALNFSFFSTVSPKKVALPLFSFHPCVS